MSDGDARTLLMTLGDLTGVGRLCCNFFKFLSKLLNGEEDTGPLVDEAVCKIESDVTLLLVGLVKFGFDCDFDSSEDIDDEFFDSNRDRVAVKFLTEEHLLSEDNSCEEGSSFFERDSLDLDRASCTSFFMVLSPI
jgi:hypothetical protein